MKSARKPARTKRPATNEASAQGNAFILPDAPLFIANARQARTHARTDTVNHKLDERRERSDNAPIASTVVRCRREGDYRPRPPSAFRRHPDASSGSAGKGGRASERAHPCSRNTAAAINQRVNYGDESTSLFLHRRGLEIFTRRHGFPSRGAKLRREGGRGR